jgi:Uma2 family endonuclease
VSVAGSQPLPRLDKSVPFRWTTGSYHRAADAGIFEDRRVELLEGEVVEMAAQGQPHVIAVSYVSDALRLAFPTGHWVRTQAPIRLSDASEPEPDISVVTGLAADYAVDPPTHAVLVVEVSDSTLDIDRRRKARMYAAAGLPEYWILNLVDRQLEVLRSPVATPAARYTQSLILSPADSVTPLAAPSAKIAIATLLPP